MERSHCLMDPFNLFLVASIFDTLFLLLPSRIWITDKPNVYLVYLCGNVSVWGVHLAWIHIMGAHHSPSSLKWFYTSVLVLFLLLTYLTIQLKGLTPYLGPIIGILLIVVLLTYTSVSSTVGSAYILGILAIAGCITWFLIGKIVYETNVPERIFFVVNIILVGLLGATAIRYIVDYSMNSYHTRGICCMIMDSSDDSTSGFWDWMGAMTDDCPLKYKDDMQVALVFTLLFRIGIELTDKHHTALAMGQKVANAVANTIITHTLLVDPPSLKHTRVSSRLKRTKKSQTNAVEENALLHVSDGSSSDSGEDERQLDEPDVVGMFVP